MSWNISLRLNNIEQQIKNLQNEGLLNPLEENIQGNGYDILNIKDIDATGDISCSTLKTNITSGVTIQSAGIECTTLNTSDDIICEQNITCNQLNYSTLNPPVGGVSETIEKVLQNGNDANNETLTNLGGLTMTGNINLNYNQLTNWNNGTVGGHLYTANGDPLGDDTRAEFGVFNNNGNNGYIMGIGDATGTLNEFNTFKIADAITNQQYLRIDNAGIQQITLSADKLLYKTDSTQPSSATGYILDSLKTPPMYKQVFSNVNKSLSIDYNPASASWLFGTNIYMGDSVFNYGVNYAEILFSYLSINFTSDDPFLPPNSCQLYLGNSPTSFYDPALGNRIIFSVVNNASDQPNFTFTSSIPIILYYQNGGLGSSFDSLYLNIQLQDQQVYNININNTNFVVSAYIAGKNTDPLAWND